MSGSGSALSFAQTSVAVDQLRAYLSQNPGSFVGTCPSKADPNGSVGAAPLGFVTICRVTGNASAPFATQTVRADQVGAYLTTAGNIVPAPAGGCPTAAGAGSGGNGGNAGGGNAGGGANGNGAASDGAIAVGAPATAKASRPTTVVVKTTPNTVVTAKGAGVKKAVKSNKKGRAVLRIQPKKAGVVTIRAARGKVVKRIGVQAKRTAGEQLTG